MSDTKTIVRRAISKDYSLVSILKEVQEERGWLQEVDLRKVSRATGVPLSEIYSIITFYPQFYLEKRGRHTITVCRGAACHVKGGKEIKKAIEKELDTAEGETTGDMRFTIETASCLGACFAAPVMVINKDIFGKMTPEKAITVLKKYR